MYKKIHFKNSKLPFITYWKLFFKSLCVQVWRNMTIMWHTKWVRACLAMAAEPVLPLELVWPPGSHKSSSAQKLWTLHFLHEKHGHLTKCSFCIVFKWIFRNANFILWCHNPLDLLCWLADSMSVTRKLVELSIYKVPYRKTFISTAVLCFLLILRILVCSFFYVTTIMQQQKFYDSVFCASIYLVENKFYSTFLDTFIYIM